MLKLICYGSKYHRPNICVIFSSFVGGFLNKTCFCLSWTLGFHALEYKYLEKMFFEYVTTKGSQHEKVFYLIQLFSTSLYLLFSIVQHLIWTGPSVFFCFFFFLIYFFVKTFEIDSIFVASYRTCIIDLQWSFLPHWTTFTDSVLKGSEALFPSFP